MATSASLICRPRPGPVGRWNRRRLVWGIFEDSVLAQRRVVPLARLCHMQQACHKMEIGDPFPSSGESTNFRFLLMRACSPRQMLGVRPIAQLVFHQRRGFTGSGAPNSRTLISRCSTDVISGASSELLSDVDIRRDLPPPLPLKRDYRLNRRPLWVKGRGRGVKLTFAPGFGRSARCFQLFPWCQELRFTGPFIDGARSQAAKVNILT